MRNRTISILLTGVVALVALAIAGCGGSSSSGKSASNAAATTVDPNAPEVTPAGDIPDNQAFVTYSPSGAGFSVKVPEGWSRSASGRATTFTDKLNAIRVERVPAAKAPTAAEARRVDQAKLAATVPGYKAGGITVVKRAGGDAVRMTYLARSQPNAVTGKAGTDAVERYTYFHNGSRVVLTLSGPKGADNVDPWKIVTDSLRWSR